MSTKFCDNLKIARALSGLTQQQVADLTGIARSTYTLYESGKREPTVEGIKKIAKALNVTGDFLLGLEEIPIDKAELHDVISKYGMKRVKAYLDALKNLE